MDNTHADITADLTDERLQQVAEAAWDDSNRNGSLAPRHLAAFRAVAALAREGWRPIPKDEGEVMSLLERRSNPCRLQRAAELLEHPQALERVPARLRRCPIHGQQGAEAWGCPECVREMRNELVEAREALRRLRRWGGLANDSGFDGAALQSVVTWIDGGMKGPLPLLPAWIGQPLP